MIETVNILELITEASLVVQIVMGILVLSSLLAWLLIFQISARVSAAASHDKRFQEWFWAGKNLSTLYQSVQSLTDKQGLEQIFHAGFLSYLKTKRHNPTDSELLEIIERKLRVSIGKQHQAMEAGLATLASIGSVAPYIGLFGTVWGIMNAFIGLSTAEQVSLSSVAPGIAEALIATAIGLFAAIPAVLAFNHFTAKINTLIESRGLFCDELTSMILRDSLVNAYASNQTNANAQDGNTQTNTQTNKAQVANSNQTNNDLLK